MPFFLEIRESVADYLEKLPVSDQVKGKIADALEHVENLSASYLADPANRWPGHTILRFQYAFRDSDGRLHVITFGINDVFAVNGVLRIVHARYTRGNDPPPRLSAPSEDE